MSHIFTQASYFENYPAISENVVKYLVEKQIKIVEVDTCSVDHEEFTAHTLFLKNDILIVENLINLKGLADKEFTVFAFPLKLNLDGSPVRVVAEIEK